MRRIAITNQKGGVGKTTTAANLGAALAMLGRRVIAVDLDPQANLTLHFGGDPSSSGRSTYTLLRGECSFAELLLPTEFRHLRLAPATVDLAGIELELANTVGRETILRDAIEAFANGVAAPGRVEGEVLLPAAARPEPGSRSPADFLLFDCPPSLGVLSLNALVAADEVLLPLQAEFLALQGVSRLLEVIELVRRRLNPALSITGVLACMVNPRTNLSTEVLGELRSFFGETLFETRIRENVRLAEAPSHGKSIFTYAADSKGAADYLGLATELLDRAKKRAPRERAPSPAPVVSSPGAAPGPRPPV